MKKTISLFVVLVAFVVGGLIVSTNIKQKAIREENEKRFGKQTISLETFRDMAASIKTPFTEAMGNLQSDFDALKMASDQLRDLGNLNAQFINGYHLNPEEFKGDKITELIASVQAEIDKSKDLLSAAQIKATMGLEALFAGTSQDGTELLKGNAENWAKVKAENEKLYEEYHDTLIAAVLDGIITAEEQKQLAELQNKVTELMRLVTDPDPSSMKHEKN